MNQMRKGPSDSTRFALLDARVTELENGDCTKEVADLRVALGKIQVQTYVTWALMLIVIGTLAKVAFG